MQFGSCGAQSTTDAGRKGGYGGLMYGGDGGGVIGGSGIAGGAGGDMGGTGGVAGP